MEINLTKAIFFPITTGIRKRLLRIIMRTFIFLLCFSTFGFTPENLLSQNVKISIDADKIVTVDEVFKIIKEQTDYRFIYKSGMFNNYPKVNLKKGVIRANSLLKQSLSNKTFNFSFGANNTIVITDKTDSFQEITITGRVLDNNGMPIPGATVYVSSIQLSGERVSSDYIIRGTSTDIDGNFSIKAEVGYYLVVSSIGFGSHNQVITGDELALTIALQERSSELDEVVVIGYGQQRREEVTSAVSSVKSDDLAKTGVAQVSFDRSLTGLLKGVNVVASTGDPAGNVDINIRGFTSPFSGSDNNPLFVIDGVPFQVNPNTTRNDETRFTEPLNPLLALNPNEVESIDVLKDAAATAIYGSRGANGVIIVNTKKGKRGTKPKVSFSTTITASEPIDLDNYLNTEQWKAYLDTYFSNTSQALEDGQISNPFILFPFGDMINLDSNFLYTGLNESSFGTVSTNWADVIYRPTAYTKNYNLSVRGGTESTAYSLNVGYNDKEGMVIEDELKQYNLRLSIDSKLSKTFETGTNLNLSYTKREQGSTGFFASPSFSGLNNRPDMPVFDENGDHILRQIDDFFEFFYPYNAPSPYASVTANTNDTKAYNVLGNVYFKANITDNFNIKADVNGGLFVTDNYTFRPATITRGVFVGLPLPGSDQSFGSDQLVINSNITTDLVANYNNSFGKHTVGASLGYSWLRESADRSNTNLQGFPDDVILTNPSNATTADVSASVIDSGLNSLFGRLTYNYDSKYFLTLTAREDKSSKFPPGNKSAFFPSASASWNIANENFLKASELVDLLRLRASVGLTGSTNVQDFAFLQGFAPGFRWGGTYNGQPAVGLGDTLANPDVSWEETNEVNFGLDFSFLNNRIRGSVDVYDRKTTGALMPTPIPVETGLSTFTSNFADMTNKGFEIELSGDILKNENFKWSAGINASQNRNTVDKLPSTYINSRFRPYVIGEPVLVIYGYNVEGIFQTQQEIDALNAASPTGSYVLPQYGNLGPGDYRYEDINNDGVINDEDGLAVIGNAEPDLFGGFNTKLSYKGFELAAYFNYVLGGELLYNEQGPINPYPRTNIIDVFTNDRWTPTNTDARFSRLVYRGGFFSDINSQINSRRIYDRSFIRLSNIQLTYNLPIEPLKMFGLSSASVFVGGSNLITWIKEYPGIDPGSAGAGNNPFGSISYPNVKSWNFGINLNF